LGLDFDGTIAPIVSDPELAASDPRLLQLLGRLTERLMAVAVISGRDTDELAERLPDGRLVLIGNHGLEDRGPAGSRLAREVEPFLPALTQADQALAQRPEAQLRGVVVERKRASISVHFRNTARPTDAGAVLEAVLRDIASATGLELHPGRLLWELRPPVLIDKGQVLRRLTVAFEADSIIYIGDDVTDEAAFIALKEMSDRRTLAVGVRSHEVPAAIFARCDLVLDGVPAVADFLESLLRANKP
jgi:trehalose 6-phosphate phosphatase